MPIVSLRFDTIRIVSHGRNARSDLEGVSTAAGGEIKFYARTSADRRWQTA